EQKELIKKDIHKGPQAFGYSQGFWDGPLLSHHIKALYGVTLGVRQCQRFFHKTGYTLQRPQTKPSGSTVEAREAFKKNC
ncbi:MAG: winged helix-turn-helix domain-containing protein, partial [Candidatus Humimicrobiaceae bacterium]